MAPLALVSPLLTSGAGFAFEHQAAAIFLTQLLGEGHCLGLPGPVRRVAMQQRSRGHRLDDIVVYGDLVDPSPWVEFQVKSTLRPTAGNSEFVEVVGQALRSLDEHAEVFEQGGALLGIVAAEPRKGLTELRQLARCCVSHSTYATFAEALLQDRVLNSEVRERFDEVCDTVVAAAAQGAPMFGTAEESAHRLLSVLQVWPLPIGDSDELSSALDRLTGLADASGVTSLTVFTHLVALAESWAPSAGVVDAATVRRQLRWRGLRFGGTRDGKQIVERLTADAVGRGPLVALGLDADFENAERLLAGGDASCAQEFARIADVLETRGHLPHAAIARRMEAKAHDAAGDVDLAALCRAELAWKHLDVVQPWEAGFALHDGQAGGARDKLSNAAQRVTALVEAAVGTAKGYGPDALVEAFDASEDADPFRDRAATALCEEAVAHEHHDLILNRQAALTSIARAAATKGSAGRRFSARIDMCLADVTGGWPGLLMRAHRMHEPPVLTWMHARYARWAALNGDGATAQHHYLLAVERACTNDMYQEAADWLYAWRTVRFWYGNLGRDEQHALAQALRAHPSARTSRLPGSQHAAEFALRSLHANKPNEALEHIRRWIWQAAIRADLTYEVEAVTALGDLAQTKGLIAEAVEYYVRAGAAEKAKTTSSAAESTLDLSTQLLRPLNASRAAAYTAVAGCADLLPDERVADWAETALAEVTGWHPNPTMVASVPAVEALSVLASLADTLTCAQAERLIGLAEPLLDRPTNHYVETDKAVTRILVALATHHRCVRRRAVHGLLHALQLNDRMAAAVLDAEDVLRANRQIVADALSGPAQLGDHHACLALVIAEADAASALDHAQFWVSEEIRSGRPRPYTLTTSTGPIDAAILVRLLSFERRHEFARTMLERALDQNASPASRRSDLIALASIAPNLHDGVRTELFPVTLRIARGDHDPEEEPTDQHPFSLVHIQMPPSGLGVDGLRCAAALATQPEQVALVDEVVTELVAVSDPDRVWALAKILYGLPGELSRLDLFHLALRPDAALRALAAARWPRNPSVLPFRVALALATDGDERVRRELALAVVDDHTDTSTEPVRSVRDVLAGDARRSIRTIAGRAGAAPRCSSDLPGGTDD